MKIENIEDNYHFNRNNITNIYFYKWFSIKPLYCNNFNVFIFLK